MCSAHHHLLVGQGFTAVNKLEMLAWSGEGYKSSLGKKTSQTSDHITFLASKPTSEVRNFSQDTNKRFWY